MVSEITIERWNINAVNSVDVIEISAHILVNDGMS